MNRKEIEPSITFRARPTMLGPILTATKVAPARCVEFPLDETLRVANNPVFQMKVPIPDYRMSFHNLPTVVEIILQKRRPCPDLIVSHVCRMPVGITAPMIQ